MRMFLKFLADEAATTAIEYALIAGGISVAIVAAVSSLGSVINAQYSTVSASFK